MNINFYQTAIEKVLNVKSEVAILPYDEALYIKRDMKKKLIEIQRNVNKQFSGLRFIITKQNACDWYLIVCYKSGPLRIFRDAFIETLFVDYLNNGIDVKRKKRGQQ
jgi:hypothetical protein